MPDTIPITERKYSLAEKVDATPEVLIVRFKPEDSNPSTFEPGMFMMISGIDATTGKQAIGRAFSIASDPSAPTLEFFIIKQPMHTGTVTKSHFVDARIGDPFMLKGPNGQFRFDPNLNKKVMFIAGGTGLAPFMSMARHIKLTKAGTDVIMLYSVKFATEVIMKNELEQLAKELNMKLVITVTRPQGQATPAAQPSTAQAGAPNPTAPSTTTTTITTTTIITTTAGTSQPAAQPQPQQAPQPKAVALEPTVPKVTVPPKQEDVPMEATRPPLQPAMVQPLISSQPKAAQATLPAQPTQAPQPQSAAPAPAAPVKPAVEQPASGAYSAETGHVDSNMISKYCADLTERTFYICGPLAFVQAIKTALTSLNIPNEKIKADIWG